MNIFPRRMPVTIFLGLTLSMAALADRGAVYAMTNQRGANANQIVVWTRAGNGHLTPLQTIGTGGGGSGVQIDGTDSLGSQGALALDGDHQFLFAVNTQTVNGGQDCQTGTISAFLIDGRDGWLTLIGSVSSGGLYPNSLTVSGNRLYVLNAGGPGNYNACGTEPNITGFYFDDSGHLTPIPSSTQSINPGPMPGSTINPAGFLNCDPGGFPSGVDCGLNPPAFPRSPAEVRFTPDGFSLAVTEKGTNSIYVFPVLSDRPGTPVIWKAGGPTQPTYFGFAFDPSGNLVVAEPFGTSATIPAKPASAASSFSLGNGGALTPITADLANGQALGCWIAIDVLGLNAFVSNNGSGTISTYQINSQGHLNLLFATAATGAAGVNDLAIVGAGDTSYLYGLASGAGTVNGWKVNSDGSLTSLGAPLGGLPVAGGAQGLAAF